jgi:hypothetical protein
LKPPPVRTFVPQESTERTEMLQTVQKIADEIRVLKVNVEAMHARMAQVGSWRSLQEVWYVRIDDSLPSPI